MTEHQIQELVALYYPKARNWAEGQVDNWLSHEDLIPSGFTMTEADHEKYEAEIISQIWEKIFK